MLTLSTVTRATTEHALSSIKCTHYSLIVNLVQLSCYYVAISKFILVLVRINHLVYVHKYKCAMKICTYL